MRGKLCILFKKQHNNVDFSSVNGLFYLFKKDCSTCYTEQDSFFECPLGVSLSNPVWDIYANYAAILKFTL